MRYICVDLVVQIVTVVSIFSDKSLIGKVESFCVTPSGFQRFFMGFLFGWTPQLF